MPNNLEAIAGLMKSPRGYQWHRLANDMTAVSCLISSLISRNVMTNGCVFVAKSRLFLFKDSKLWAIFQRAWHALMHVTVTGKYVVQNTTQSIPMQAVHTTCINTCGQCMRFPHVSACVKNLEAIAGLFSHIILMSSSSSES